MVSFSICLLLLVNSGEGFLPSLMLLDLREIIKSGNRFNVSTDIKASPGYENINWYGMMTLPARQEICLIWDFQFVSHGEDNT